MDTKLYVRKNGKVGIVVGDEPPPADATTILTPKTEEERTMLSDFAHRVIAKREQPAPPPNPSIESDEDGASGPKSERRRTPTTPTFGGHIPPLPEEDWGHRR